MASGELSKDVALAHQWHIEDLALSYQRNLVYRSDNPNPAAVCALCRNTLGHVFIPGSQPALPRHHGCLCYYNTTIREPTDYYDVSEHSYTRP